MILRRFLKLVAITAGALIGLVVILFASFAIELRLHPFKRHWTCLTYDSEGHEGACNAAMVIADPPPEDPAIADPLDRVFCRGPRPTSACRSEMANGRLKTTPPD